VESNVDIIVVTLQHLINMYQGKPLKIAAASKFGEVCIAAGVPVEVSGG